MLVDVDAASVATDIGLESLLLSMEAEEGVESADEVGEEVDFKEETEESDEEREENVALE